MPLAPCSCLWGAEEQPLWAEGHWWGQHLLPFQSLYLDTLHALEDLLRSVLRRNLTPQGLQIMVEVCSGVVCTPGGRRHLAADSCLSGTSLPGGSTGAVQCFLPCCGVCGQLCMWGQALTQVGPRACSPVPSISCRLDAEIPQVLQV